MNPFTHTNFTSHTASSEHKLEELEKLYKIYSARRTLHWKSDVPTLYDYQTKDVNLMLGLEKSRSWCGGINANEMGLGKTGKIL